MKNAVIIGGTSGLGNLLADRLASTYGVTITGRTYPDHKYAFIPLDLSNNLPKRLDAFMQHMPEINLLVYAAGFYQEGKIDELTDEQIIKMNNVGFLAPALLLQRIIKKQGKLEGFIGVTSTSQWTPRLSEPVYNGVKAGFGMFANAIGLDERIEKTLVVGPAGMKTRFWRDHPDKDLKDMLDPEYVADETLKLFQKGDHTYDFQYKYARILRNPARVEIIEQRDRTTR